jgi:hypothetical protein
MAKLERQKRKRKLKKANELSASEAEFVLQLLELATEWDKETSAKPGRVPMPVAIIDAGLRSLLETPTLPPAEQRSFKTLLFLTALATERHQREAVLGDIQERFEKDCKLFGEKRACYLMIRDLLRDYASSFKSSFGKAVRTVLKYLGLGGIVRYFLS